MKCPITNMECPHLTMLETQKDKALDSDSMLFVRELNPGEELEDTLIEFPYELLPYEAQAAVISTVTKHPNICIDNIGTSACGLMVSMGIEN